MPASIKQPAYPWQDHGRGDDDEGADRPENDNRCDGDPQKSDGLSQKAAGIEIVEDSANVLSGPGSQSRDPSRRLPERRYCRQPSLKRNLEALVVLALPGRRRRQVLRRQ